MYFYYQVGQGISWDFFDINGNGGGIGGVGVIRVSGPVITPDGKYSITDYSKCHSSSDLFLRNDFYNYVNIYNGTPTSLVVNSAGNAYIQVVNGKQFYVGPICGTPYFYTSNFPIYQNNIVKNIGTNFTGYKVGATTSANGIWISNNMAKTWSQSSASSSINWNEIVMSDDGNFIAASSTGNKIYTSLDGGVTWQVTNSPTANWSSLSMSADGQIIIAIAQDTNTLINSIYMSTNYGNSWQQVNNGVNMPLNGWNTVFVTASGNKLYAHNENGQLWVLKSSGIQGGAFESVTLQYNGDNTWSITNMTGNNLRNY